MKNPFFLLFLFLPVEDRNYLFDGRDVFLSFEENS